MRHVEQIAQRPHPMGSEDHERVRDYIVGQISALGLRPQVQQATAIGTRYREAGRVQNILTRVPGTAPNGKAVLVIVHYDGIEAGPSAADDGAGCAALLETLRALQARKRPLTHDVVALFTDGEGAHARLLSLPGSEILSDPLEALYVASVALHRQCKITKSASDPAFTTARRDALEANRAFQAATRKLLGK